MEYKKYALTPSQMVVANLLDAGHSKAQIAVKLKIAERNVYKMQERIRFIAI
jgi:DNA-binding CsgD family transcriptional regulator